MADDFYAALGRRVADLRKARGMSQEALAEDAMIGTSYLSRIEAGTRKPTLDVLMKMAEALGTPLWRFIADERLTAEELAWKGTAQKVGAALRGLPREDVDLVLGLLVHLRKLRKVPRIA